MAPVLHDLAVLVDSRHDCTVERLDELCGRLSAMEQRRHGLVMLAAGVGIGIGVMVVVAVVLVRMLGGG